MRRSIAVLAVALVVLTGAAHKKPKPQPPISIVINGLALPVEPQPLLDNGILLVPVRRTVLALGLDFTSQGSQMITHVGAKTVILRDRSRVALVDGSPVTLDAPAELRNWVFYAPLRFFTDVLGAEATFDRRAHVVSIVSQLVGRSGLGDFTEGDRTIKVGTVTAVDVDSDPPTITLAFNDRVRTIPITRNAIITIRDVGVDVDVPGELTDIRPGDYAEIAVLRNGDTASVVDEYGSRYGEIVVTDPDELLLEDGHVIVPDRDTEISLNGKAAAFGDLLPGDYATIRYNVETGEVREIVAARAAVPTSAQSGTASISDVETDATHALRAGDTLTVTMHATPGGAATFDIGSYVQSIAMTEHPPGTYVGSYQIERSANFFDTPILGHLQMPDGSSVVASSAQSLSASGGAPGVASVGPADGARVNLDAPAVYATFVTDAVPVSPSSIFLSVGGHDVTPECLRTAQFVQYLPQRTYPRGPVHVTVRVSDQAGNTTTKSWTFYIQ